MKRILSVLTAVIILVASLSVSAFAVKEADGLDALRAQFKDGVGPEKSGFALDYVYYAPEGAEESTQKLPLFVFMSGLGEGAYAGNQLTGNEFAYWSCEEYQARVAYTGSAYLLILRSPDPICFDTLPIDCMKAAIDDFVANNNVDKTRIYLTGWCIGATGAVRLATTYEGEYAGLLLISPRDRISADDAEKLKNTAVWLFGCTTDYYSNYYLSTKASFTNLCAAAEDRAKLRLTSCTSAPTAALLTNHKLWTLCERDYSYLSQQNYTKLQTVTAEGTLLPSPKVINWISLWSTGKNGHSHELKSTVVKATFESNGRYSAYCQTCGYVYPSETLYSVLEPVMNEDTFCYMGTPVSPLVTVTDSEGNVLKKGTDYTVSYRDNDAPGTAYADITLTGKYSGEYTLEYTLYVIPQGDFDMDGTVTVTDARSILRIAIGLDSDINQYCDTNSDGGITVADARMALRIAIGLNED